MEFLDKIYSNEKLFAMVYIVGAILLLIFIIMLIVSLKKPKTKKLNSKILEEKSKKQEETVEPITPPFEVETKTEEPAPVQEPNEINKEETKENIVIEEKTNVEEPKVEEQKVEESKVEESKVETTENIPEEKETTESENTISKALDNVENKDIMNIEPETVEPKVSLSSEIPDVDEYVDKVVKKTYEKNEQFSSVFVGDNTSTIKLDKVLDGLNVDEDIKVDIVPEEEKTVVPDETTELPILIQEQKEDVVKETKPLEIDPDILEGRETNQEVEVVEEKVEESEVKTQDTLSNLDDLKKAMEMKKNSVSSKQDELKAKLAGLKPEKKDDVMKAEDLLNKLNSMKGE